MLYHLLVLHRYISKAGNEEGEQRKKNWEARKGENEKKS